jgi:hypothetical protein
MHLDGSFRVLATDPSLWHTDAAQGPSTPSGHRSYAGCRKLAAFACACAARARPNWVPLTGMVKRQCDQCRYFFAVPADSHEPRCPDRVRVGSPPRVRLR